MTRTEPQSPSKEVAVAISPNLLRKQRAAIATFAEDNRRLKEELLEETKFSSDPTTQAGKKLIQNLEHQDETYEKLIEEQQDVMNALIAKETELQAAISVQQAAMGGINRAAEISIRTQRRVILLENRVQQALSARSGAELQAAKLKEKVDSLRREKRLFEELTAKMENAVEAKAREIAEILAKTTEAHESRGKAEAMRAQVLAQIAKDAATSEAEWQQLNGVIEKERANREAEQERRSSERAARLEALLQKQRGVVAGRGGSSTSKITAKPAVGADAVVQPQREDHDRSEEDEFADVKGRLPVERLQMVEEKLAAVAASIVPGGKSADEAVTAFIELKDLCFRLFALLTESHTRLEALEDEVVRSRALAAAVDAAAAVAMEKESSAAADKTASNLKLLLDQAENQVEAVCGEVHRLCQRVRYNCPEMDTALQKEGPPTASTLLGFIGRLEQWCTAGLRQHMATSLSGCTEDEGLSGTGGGSWTPFYLKNGVDHGPTALLDPPSVGFRGHRSSLGGRSGSGGSSSIDGGRRKYKGGGVGKPQGNNNSKGNRQSQATSEATSDASSKVLGLEVLEQRAQRAVAMRLANAAIISIDAQPHK